MRYRKSIENNREKAPSRAAQDKAEKTPGGACLYKEDFHKILGSDEAGREARVIGTKVQQICIMATRGVLLLFDKCRKIEKLQDDIVKFVEVISVIRTIVPKIRNKIIDTIA
ncbi:hypothetical protein J6590_094041 [Homalodisca vitripennis]|nr:hypothetical protein J6590_094041 [Homalodisca vitripennis]